MFSVISRGFDNVKNKLSKTVGTFMDGGVEGANATILNNLQDSYPARVTHDENNPYQWENERQRKAVMAKLRAENNLPYKRTDKLKQGWRIEGTGKNQYIANNVEYASYVVGAAQQKGHAADGWRDFMSNPRAAIKSKSAILAAFASGGWKAVKRLWF